MKKLLLIPLAAMALLLGIAVPAQATGGVSGIVRSCTDGDEDVFTVTLSYYVPNNTDPTFYPRSYSLKMHFGSVYSQNDTRVKYQQFWEDYYDSSANTYGAVISHSLPVSGNTITFTGGTYTTTHPFTRWGFDIETFVPDGSGTGITHEDGCTIWFSRNSST